MENEYKILYNDFVDRHYAQNKGYNVLKNDKNA